MKSNDNAPKFYAVESAGYWFIQSGPNYEDPDILDAEKAGKEQAEKNARLISDLLNAYYAHQSGPRWVRASEEKPVKSSIAEWGELVGRLYPPKNGSMVFEAPGTSVRFQENDSCWEEVKWLDESSPVVSSVQDKEYSRRLADLNHVVINACMNLYRLCEVDLAHSYLDKIIEQVKQFSQPNNSPAVSSGEGMGCVSGCKKFTGNEVYHHKDCTHYSESMSKMFDDLKRNSEGVAEALIIPTDLRIKEKADEFLNEYASDFPPNERTCFAAGATWMRGFITKHSSLSPAGDGGSAWVKELNERQKSGMVHPYTCDRKHKDCEVNCDPRDYSKDGVLIATEHGWICPCGNYAQPLPKPYDTEKNKL